MEGNVVWYGIETFHLEYSFLDEKYWNLEMYGQRTTQKSGRCLFSPYLIKEGRVRKNMNFNLTDITQDQKLLALLLPKNNDFYPISIFYKQFTNFQSTGEGFKKLCEFESQDYKYSDLEISDLSS